MHEVGQIIFLVSRKAQSVLAAQVCEQNVRKTLEGEETSFRVRIGGASDDTDELTLYDLDRIDADIYSSPEEATENLYTIAKSAIDSLVSDAVDDATQYFNYQRIPIKKPTRGKGRKSSTTKKTSTAKTKTPVEPKEDPSATYITMPDGTRAKLKTPIDTTIQPSPSE